MSKALEQLAREVGVNERTLRRAVTDGTIRAKRTSPYKLDLPVSERRYVRSHWSALGALRAALRTEPSVECAVLFGSAARGDDEPVSDVDVLVWLRDGSSAARFALARRLTTRVGREVQVVDARDAHERPSLLLSILRDGRVLVDRTGRWQKLNARAAGLRRAAVKQQRELVSRAEEARAFFAGSATSS